MTAEIYQGNQAKQHRILIVDDNPRNLQVLGRILQEKNYAIEFATNGLAALEWLDNSVFDLILLDINMPGIDGFEVCANIRSREAFNNMPVIFLSANSDRESILKGFDQGAQDYVTKPFDSRELLVRVKTHLELKDSQEYLQDANKVLEEKVTERTVHLQQANKLLQELNIELSKAKEKAEASDKLKSAFLNNISHEIRTPLNGIVGFSSFLMDDEINPEDKSSFLKILNESTNRLVQTITDYVDISMLVSGTLIPNYSYFNLWDVFYAILEKHVTAAKEKENRISLLPTADTGDFLTFNDDILLQKVLNHLVGNAIKFTKQGEIHLGLTKDHSNIVLSIKDTGIGISKESHDKIFETFVQENIAATRGHEGSGLGLSISYGIMQVLKGSIRIESEKGIGTLVELRIPV